MTQQNWGEKIDFFYEEISEQPNNKPVVYRMLDKDKKSVYIGVADKGGFIDRLMGHFLVGNMPIEYFDFQICKTMQEAKKKANEAKDIEKPKYNQNYEINGWVIEKTKVAKD